MVKRSFQKNYSKLSEKSLMDFLALYKNPRQQYLHFRLIARYLQCQNVMNLCQEAGLSPLRTIANCSK